MVGSAGVTSVLFWVMLTLKRGPLKVTTVVETLLDVTVVAGVVFDCALAVATLVMEPAVMSGGSTTM